MALKPHHTSSLFRKPNDVIDFEQKRGLVYQISCRDCNAVYVGLGETGRSVIFLLCLEPFPNLVIVDLVFVDLYSGIICQLI